ncbi:type VI secretion system protein TssA [Methylomonas sp. AM2-LC]|uniref:type VI secretion system protein TssA n=1 Tax=Methylomonas sp. AM2-LC TaxID=3153301 RepID=UPI003266BCB8
MADISELTSEISSDLPCGSDLEYDSGRLALNTAIQGTPEDQFSGQKFEPPNWREIQKQSVTLLKKSKDLQVILYLIRALIPLEGVCGLRDGLNLLEQTLKAYWPVVYPLLDPDDNDPTQRLNIIEELCSWEYILNPLSVCILVESKSIGRVSLRDIQYANEKLPVPAGITKPEVNVIKAVFDDNDPEQLQILYQAILDSEQLVKQIESIVADNVTGIGNGVNLEALKSLLKEMHFSFDQFVEASSADDNNTKEQDEVGDDSSTTQSRGKTANKGIGDISSRSDVIKTLDLICKYYAENEPSSPVPILLERAKKLAVANFMEIIMNLAPDALNQIENIKGPESESN